MGRLHVAADDPAGAAVLCALLHVPLDPLLGRRGMQLTEPSDHLQVSTELIVVEMWQAATASCAWTLPARWRSLFGAEHAAHP